MIDSRIYLEEIYESEEHGTTTLYFIAPKEMLDGKYPNAEHTEICIEFPTNKPEAHYSSVRFSPSRYDEEKQAFTDYDWYDVEMSYEDIEALIELAERRNQK